MAEDMGRNLCPTPRKPDKSGRSKYSLHSVMIAIFSHDTVTKGTKYAYQSINHIKNTFLISAIPFWQDSSIDY